MSSAIATNKKAFRDYFLSNQIECGIELQGSEVKSLRAGEVNFKDSFARIEGNEVYLYSLYIAPYLQASYLNIDPERKRRLLMHKKEIKRLGSTVAEKNLTLVPTKIYFNKRGLIKVEIALGKGKKMYDKRETIKKKDINRELQRVMRSKLK